MVVNWFQIMFLFLVRQPTKKPLHKLPRCELISNYVLIFGSTTKGINNLSGVWLWIDFKLCSYFWFDNLSINSSALLLLWIDFKLCSYFWFDNLILVWNSYCLVVNWFQIMFLFLVRQLPLDCRLRHTCCELISNYVLIFGSTTLKRSVYVNGSLWIDFKLCSYFWFDNWLLL